MTNKPGKFHMIVELLTPAGASLNDESSLCSLCYASIEDAVYLVQNTKAWGALMAKLDLRSAYHEVPVHEDGQPLLAIEWQEVR